MGFPGDSVGKESACNVGDLGSIPRLRRSPGEGKGYPLQYSGLENPMDCVVHGVTKSQTWLSDFHKGDKAKGGSKLQSLSSYPSRYVDLWNNTKGQHRDSRQSWHLSDSRRCSRQRVFPPAVLLCQPLTPAGNSTPVGTAPRKQGGTKEAKGGCHLAEAGFGWPKWDPLEPGLDPDHRHRVKVEWCLASPLWSHTEWKGKHTPRSDGSKQTCPRATLSELLINTSTDITHPGLGLDDMVKERKQNLNHAPRACSDRYPCYSSLISKTWSPEQTTNLSQFTNQLQLKHWFTKLQANPKSGRES